MNKSEAKKIVENGITYGEIKNLLAEARKNYTNWTNPSKCNKGLDVGTMFNIMWKHYGKIEGEELNETIEGINKLSAKNILWQFSKIKTEKTEKPIISIHHENPMDLKFDTIEDMPF